jgi:hypothetical protein
MADETAWERVTYNEVGRPSLAFNRLVPVG